MSDSWTIARLSDVLSEISDRAGKQNLDVLSVTEKRGIIPQSDVFNRRIATEDISDYKVLEPLDIAFNPYLLWAGAIGQWMGETRGVVSPVYPCFRAKESENSRWLGLVFESAVLRPYFDSTAIGSIVRRRRTTIPVFLNAELQRPPRSVQNRIVDVISSVDSYIAALQQQADAARVARSAVLSELLSAGGEDWIEMTIESFARLVPGKYIPKSKYEENGSYFIYGSNSVMGKYSTALIDVPHVVMAAIGAYAGAVRYSSQPSWVNNNAFGLVTNDNVDPFFFYLWLEQCLDLRQVVVGTGQPYVQRPALKNTVVNVPPVKEQRRIVDIVSSLDEVFSSTERAIIEAKRLRSGLLSDLLSGHHEIPESYDQLLGAA